MCAKMTMIYWKGEHPAGTLKVREANLKDAYDMMVMEDVLLSIMKKPSPYEQVNMEEVW